MIFFRFGFAGLKITLIFAALLSNTVWQFNLIPLEVED